jgi:uncharacterized protein (DUF302 family)
MSHHERRVVVDSGFESVLGGLSRAIRAEGMQVISRIDVRDHFWRDLETNFQRYILLEAWSPDLALEALQQDLDIGTDLPTTFAVYELADNRTAVVATEPLGSVGAERRQKVPAVAAIADRECERVARVLGRLEHAAFTNLGSEGTVEPRSS